LQDRHVEGDWPDLFDAPSHRVRAVFLGDAAVPDDHAGVLELNVFDGDIPTGPPPWDGRNRRRRWRRQAVQNLSMPARAARGSDSNNT
jgi:hypothetical protein